MKSKRERFKKVAKDFRKFASQGDIINLAIGVVIGTAFKDIVNSLVSDIILPPINYLTANINFTDLFLPLSTRHYGSLIDAEAAGVPIIKYGNFINSVIDFLVISMVIFLVVKQLQKVLRKEEAKVEKTTKSCPYCDSKISKKASICPFCTSKLPKESIKSGT